MSEIISMHFTLDGDGFTKIVQQRYAWEDRENARELIDGIIGLNAKQRRMILEGEGALTGITVCDDKENCHQCKDRKNEMKFIIIEDEEYKKALYKRNIPTKLTKKNFVQITVITNNKVKHTFQLKRALLDNYCNVIDSSERQIKMINARDIDPYKKSEQITQLDHNKANAHTRIIKDLGLEYKYDEFGELLDKAFNRYWISAYRDKKRPDKITVHPDKRVTVKFNNQTKPATDARVKKGKITTNKIVEFIKKSENGLTIYQLSKLVGKSAGTCFKAIQRSKIKFEITKEVDDQNVRKRYRFVN